MSEKKFTPETKVLAIEWYIPDGWYGKRRRVVLTSTEDAGFRTASEAKSHAARLKHFAKDKYGVKESPLFKTIEGCPTYIYCGAGPSYSCTNIYITIADLDLFQAKYEQSEEFREKQRKAEFRRWMKENRPGSLAKR